MVSDMQKARNAVTPVLFNTAAEWVRTVKRTIARYARGNIAAQNQRVLLPEEQEKEHHEARRVTHRWSRRHRSA
jgi:hypothetical protein